MKLQEILADKELLRMAYQHLKKLGLTVHLESIWVFVEGSAFNVHLFPDDDELWDIVWYHNGKKAGHDHHLTFEKAVEELLPLKPVKESLFSDHEMAELMLNLITKAGFEAKLAFLRGKRCIIGAFGDKTARSFRVRKEIGTEEWLLDLLSGQGHKTKIGHGDEQWIITKLKELDKKPMKESEDHPLLVTIVNQLLDKGAVVLLNAHGQRFRTGNATIGWSSKRHLASGFVNSFSEDGRYIDYSPSYSARPPEGQHSRALFTLHQPIDDHYTLKKLGPDRFEIVDAEPVAESLFSKEERVAMLLVILKKAGFYAKINKYAKDVINVFHIGERGIRIAPHGQSWSIEYTSDTGVHKKRLQLEHDVIDFLNSLRPVQEARAKKVEPKVQYGEEDLKRVRQAVGLLFEVQAKMEKLDDLWADQGSGGVGIYMHFISFRWMGGGGEKPPKRETQLCQKYVMEAVQTRPELKQIFTGQSMQVDEEGSVDFPWAVHDISGPEMKRFWAAFHDNVSSVDYEDMKKDFDAL